MTNAQPSVWERMYPWALPGILVLGFIIRMLFVHQSGFQTDITTFEAWALSAHDNGLGNFYAKTSFADYPPGYFYILAFIGGIWAPFKAHDPSYSLLAVLVKMPAILADLGIGALLYAVVRRFASPALALGAAAFYVFNPATIFISADWGQVDAIAGGFALLGAYLLLKSDDGPVDRFSWYIPAAWVALAYSLLIKPQAAAVIPVFIAFAFTDRVRMRARITATIAGIALAFVFAIALVEPFHASNPIAAMVWLLARYNVGSHVYQFNSVNAFNLWAIRGAMWQPDSQPIGFGLLAFAQSTWGIGLVVAALALIVWRYLQDATPESFLEACALGLLAFFVLATRMHERYSFNGLLFCIACLPIARRYLWASIALTVVLFANLIYSLQYLSAVQGGMPGADPHNLWGVWTSLYSLLAVGTFFALGYSYLGDIARVDDEAAVAVHRPGEHRADGASLQSWWRQIRPYFDPKEGLSVLRAPLDYVLMGALGVASFVISYVGYWYPSKTDQCWTIAGVTRCGVFDEIYFARAADEYLRNLRIYENTHPPLSKLLVTLSTMLMGGLAHGDNTYGWRFLDVVFGALVVMLLFAFAKRITRSSAFATLAAAFLMFDGMHFVQSRIATPEGFVVLFSLAAVYAFYRFWIASQVEERKHVVVPPLAFAGAVVVALICGVIVVGIWDAIWLHIPNPGKLDTASSIIITLYVALGVYLLARYVAFPTMYADGAIEQTFPDGSYALVDPQLTAVFAPDGGGIESVGPGKPKVRSGAHSQARANTLEYRDGDVAIAYRTEPSVTYATPDGEATYASNEIRCDDAREKGRSATFWLVTFTVALGLLVSSKWYGVMGFGVSFTALIFVWLQRFFRVGKGKIALWGNPRGFRLDGALVTIVFISMTIYGLVWVPDLVRQSPDPNEIHNFNDVVARQYSMFEYHDTLKATHPYSSKFWEWPLDYVPIAYFYQDNRANKSDDNACCVQEITSMPNPFILWFGLMCVPLVGFLAWKEKNKGYLLIVLTYLLQWLPWAKSPRITFAYHFYVDIPLICLCNAIVLQRIWNWAKTKSDSNRWIGFGAVGAITAIIVFGFVYFYPILSAQKITWAAWHARMWMINNKWVVGPG
ncbi:MAG TPA: phospholipid carrier-dependent glycosyltransferase [Candidatus Aquilonibacter sp.]|nr:phospholipid carrier-dependent glycosyltransferase [Candidatus Aquilonibacter sp.]